MATTRLNGLAAARRVVFATAIAGLAVVPASVGAVSFPSYPLQTGSPLPPNILFILDDSGSMGFLRMPTDTSGEMSDSLATKASDNNTVYYDPAVTYRPWMTATGARMTGGTSFNAVYGDYDQASGNTIDLADSGSCRSYSQNGSNISVCGGPTQATYYVLKSGQTSSTSDNTRYYRYQILTVSGQVRVVRSDWLKTGTTSSSMGCPDPGNNKNGWRNCTFATPGRSEADEITNFATWFSYSRSRMKMAKSGATEAFSTLGSNVRVGFRTIWNRNNFDIPVQDGNSGLFEDARTPVTTTSRSTWFARVTGADSSNGTPLQGALQKAGDYYMQTAASGPYGPEASTAQFQCRQNFTILTTDGYWNDTSNFSSGTMGEQDSNDGSAIFNPLDNTTSVRYTARIPYSAPTSNTLGDIAMKYWKNDLRTDLANKVPTATTDPAFWQHMVTFGISIGNKGGLDQDSVADVIRDGSPRINGVNVPWPVAGSGKTSENIDDLLHASVNGHGEFIAATNSSMFADALSDVLGKIQERLASGSNVATNSTSFQSDTRMYQAKFTSGQWTGDLEAYDVTAAGGIAANAAWKTAARINASLTDGDTSNDFTARTVLTWDVSGNRSASFPTTAQAAALARGTGTDAVTGAVNAAYIKGSRANEISNNGSLRNRTNLLGDIVDSSPFYLKDNETIFVGANDGMLHAINALTGDVRYSYVPAGIDFSKLATFSDPNYEHAYFVDGPVAVSAQSAVGGNYLVGTLGRGGKGVFALDVGNTTSPTVLWDKTAAIDNDMGYVLGVPLVVKANNGSAVAIVSNGIDSTNGSATLYVYDISSGTLLKKFVVDTGSNGLSAPRGADTDGDGDIDYVYAGDLKGKLWKFDLSGATVASWNVAFSGQPMFQTASNQPITGGLAIAREPGTRRIFITFGTGRMISQGDLTTTYTQALYAIIDDGTIVQRSDLTQRTIAATGQVSGKSVRAFEMYSTLPAASKGWYLNLGTPTPGERVISGPRIKGRAAFYSSVIPASGGSSCDPGGTGYVNVLDLFTGTSPQSEGGSSSFFDLNGSGSGNDDTITSGGQQFPIGSVDLGVGMPTESAQIDNFVVVGGSTGGHAGVAVSGISGQAKRVGWREIFNRD
ncbi:pilus assembly protein [Lysobacter claricitrinus]|uniref:pilus assembly protein n=1 Tax=Lysobacter claricitrinus TaxID=3367728 RepID=UPI0038B30DA6